MKPVLFLCLLSLALFAADANAQSPWARSKAGFYAQAAWQFIPAYSTLFGNNGADNEIVREVSENIFQFYGEYGISRRTTIIAALPLVYNRRGDLNPEFPNTFGQVDSGSIFGLGNVHIAARHQFVAGKVAFAGALRMGLPAPKHQQNTGLRTGVDALTVLPVLSVGMGLGKTYWFAYGGYGIRTNDYSHFLNAGVEGGIHIGKIWLMAFSEFVGSLENGSRPLPAPDVFTGLYVNDQGWLSIGLKSIVEFNRFWGLNLSAAGAAWGQNVPQQPAFSLGTYFKWD
ncbi:MAG: hypothetical protein EPGJADBJ_05498 [Saprospiraceae bacterium]|nr:hypothetical protein [Saprospiraceae bacterium]